MVPEYDLVIYDTFKAVCYSKKRRVKKSQSIIINSQIYDLIIFPVGSLTLEIE